MPASSGGQNRTKTASVSLPYPTKPKSGPHPLRKLPSLCPIGAVWWVFSQANRIPADLLETIADQGGKSGRGGTGRGQRYLKVHNNFVFCHSKLFLAF